MAHPHESTNLQMYTTMVKTRRFEETFEAEFLQGKVPGFIHLYIGEEACAAGVCAALHPRDYVTSTHRGHGHAIAKGANLRHMAAELVGKKTGLCRGKGGSMHVADFKLGILGANGISGGGFGIACGAALSSWLRGTDQVTVCFFGDGAASKGTFHESLNFATVRKLPVVFVCENNGFALNTDPKFTLCVQDVADLAKGYGIPGVVVDGNNVLAVYEATSHAVERARQGEGPSLLELKTYRVKGHNVGDPEKYRTKEEVVAWRKKDPILRFENYLLENGEATAEELQKIRDEVEVEMIDALQFAQDSPWPEPEEAFQDFWVDHSPVANSDQPPGKLQQKIYGEATREAVAGIMRRDPSVFIIGMDVRWGGNFGQFLGAYEEFGPKRVIDTPISESMIVAAAIGAAVTGLRPIVAMNFVDFAFSAMDELFNQLAKFRYMSGGQVTVPVVVRVSDGAVRSAAAQHSQNLESLFNHIPGIRVVTASSVDDAKGLITAALLSDDPVIVMENKVLLTSRGMAPEGEYIVPLGNARIQREGNGLTIITYSISVLRSIDAAEKLAAEGIDCEVIDLRSLSPLDFETIARSVKKTKRVMVVHEAWKNGGFGGEVASRIGEELFDYLDAPVVRVGAPHYPMPFSPALEKMIVPQVEQIMAEARALARQ